MHSNSDKFTEREDGLPDRLRAIAADEIEGRRPVLSPGNSHDLLAAAAEIERLRTAIRRLAEQEATLSVQGGNVTVTMDATLTDAERALLEMLADHPVTHEIMPNEVATLRGLLNRHFPTPENPPTQDNTPEPHSTQSECSVQELGNERIN